MIIPELANTRTLTLVVPESDWRALSDLEPDAVRWLQAQIRDRVLATRRGHDDAAPVEWLSGDEY